MNILSWAIYGISTVDRLGHWVAGVSVFTFFLLLASGLIKIASFFLSKDPSCNGISQETYRQISAFVSKVYKVAVPVFIICEFLSVVVPDRKTMIMVAASEVGDRLVASKNLSNELIDPSIDLLKIYVKTELEKQKLDLEKIVTDEKKKIVKKAKEAIDNIDESH